MLPVSLSVGVVAAQTCQLSGDIMLCGLASVGTPSQTKVAMTFNVSCLPKPPSHTHSLSCVYLSSTHLLPTSSAPCLFLFFTPLISFILLLYFYHHSFALFQDSWEPDSQKNYSLSLCLPETLSSSFH